MNMSMVMGSNNGDWGGGVRQGIYKPELINAVCVEANLSGLPLSVSSNRSQYSDKSLGYKQVVPFGDKKATMKFTASRYKAGGRGVPYPTVDHQQCFMTLVAMFAHNFNPEGILFFRIGDVLRNMGKTSNSAYTLVHETILRYSYLEFHAEHWTIKQEKAFTDHNGITHIRTLPVGKNYHGTFIAVEDVVPPESIRDQMKLDEVRNELRKNVVKSNPSKSHMKLHEIHFHKAIVDSLGSKNLRLHRPEIFKNLKPANMKLFIYFYRLWSGKINQPSRITYDRLLQQFHWQSPPKRFEPWIKKELEALKQAGGYILDYEVPPFHPRSWVEVQICKQHMTKTEIAIEVEKREKEKNDRQRKEKAKEIIDQFKTWLGPNHGTVKQLEKRFANGDYGFINENQS